MNLTRRAILASAGIAGAFFVMPAIAKAPISERVEKWLAQMVYGGNFSVHVQAVDPEVLEALRAGALAEQHDAWVPDSPSNVVTISRRDMVRLTPRGVEMGQVFLAARLGRHARFLMAQAIDSKPAKQGYAYKVLRGSEAENANFKRVFGKPYSNGALPRTVLTQEQAARGDWRMVLLREAYLRPAAAGSTLIALERTPAGEDWYQACLIDQQYDRVEARLKKMGIKPVFDMNRAEAFAVNFGRGKIVAAG
ncbi:hypothetical protein HOU02_gp231 [Caulobacter phage CcrBL9]|uniref:Uncharacterized protein n=1 Tax=Caulobacter phage CcrBL9 TaxID=2283270 RepID=A0A385EC82_9CAUD|nr:hypothetical protein HOU02_gp231 [Caulobacter phage CcrBL9]AXQ69494.1 hypothetical protein CcrBL9_gp470 [Caulobacter phage CcrBL9]